ncbi:MAG: hypothetical protein IBJ11_07665 [Phycisphaerales bacterium]|nr:hypothetical protein [Phycisphaerales bacterium]
MFSNTRAVFGLAIVALACGGTASADVVRGSTIGPSVAGWQPFPATLNAYSNADRPYWDQASMDSSNRNIGNWVSNTYTPSLPANGSVPGPGTRPAWWGYSTRANLTLPTASNEDSRISFQATPGRTVIRASLRTEVAVNQGFNEIGWYNRNAPVGSEAFNVIFRGPDLPVMTVDFTPSSDWGLYIRSFNGFSEASGNGLYFFSESHRNRAVGFGSNAPAINTNHQHFAIFATDLTAGRESYIVGAEDLPLANSGIEKGGDYNDVIFTLQTVPSPGAAVLFGLAGVAAIRRRR